jgi:hypothetical protein
LLGILAARREWRPCGEAAGVLAGWAVVLGVLDELTWGHFFHSARTYVRFNVVEDRADAWGTSPADYYLDTLWTGMPEMALLLGGLALFAVRRAPGLAVACVAFLVLHSIVGHKELRFLMTMTPLLCALAAVGADTITERLHAGLGRLAAHALALVALVTGLHAGGLTFADVGAHPDRAAASAWDDYGTVNRLLLRARERDDLCALKVEAPHWAWTGGYTYFHRDLRLYRHDAPPRASQLYNYVITPDVSQRDGRVVAGEPPYVLVRLDHGRCAPDPAFTTEPPA